MQTKYLSKHGKRLSQLLKGAVVVTFCQNEAEVKCQMDIDFHISLTEQVQSVWFSLLGLWMNFGGQFPWKFLVLPHSGRGSCQLLLYRTDTFVLGTVNSVMYSFLPCLMLFILNLAIIVKLMVIKMKPMESTKNLSNLFMSTVYMLLSVSLAFVALTTPIAILDISDSLESVDFGSTFRMAAIFLSYVQHGCNGFLYCLVGTKFRKEALGVLHLWRKEDSKREHTSSRFTSINSITQ